MVVSARAWLCATALGCGVSVAVIAACGDDDAEPVSQTATDGSPPDVTIDVGPVRAEFGLDERPANPTCHAPPRPTPTGGVAFQPVFANVAVAPSPYRTSIVQDPNDKTRWFASYADGKLVSFPAQNPPNTPTVVADLAVLAGVPVNVEGEGAFFGFAFHPKFATNGRVYVSWTAREGPTEMRSRVGYITSADGGKTFTSYTNLISFDQPYKNHNGGGILFGPDGYLYLSFGDGGAGGDVLAKGQKTTELFSKIVRIDVDNIPAGQPYGIPADNPFKGDAGEPAAFAYGFRNPFRFTFDRGSGDLWVGDVGQELYEEIDIVKLGGNYGWSCREGAHPYPYVYCPSKGVGTIDPVFEYTHTTASHAIVGGYVYRGSAIPDLVGAYVYGDWGTGAVFALTFDATTGLPSSKQLNPSGPAMPMAAFAEDADGELYVVDVYAPVQKLVPAPLPADAGTPGPSFPARLSKTGCVDPQDPKRPASGLIPFSVNAALWSDGAEKDRWIALPDGKRITIGADGDFDLPAGSVVMKTFRVEEKRIETRLLVRHDDGEWTGYSYEWLDDQTDAVLLAASKRKSVGSLSWYFPSRSDCVRCHTQAAGRTLGLELGQLNSEITYTSTNRISNQLRTLDHIELFDKHLDKPVEQILAYPVPTGTGSLDGRARAYLHANCSMCHRPNGGARGEMDLRFARTFVETKTCNVEGQTGDLGIAGAKLFAPGEPTKSQLSIRPRAVGANRMPPLASNVVDPEGTTLIDSWIKSATACP
jgi:uncharacterized repeat protein (TIGR03806 family)